MIAATLFSGIGAPETAKPDWRWIWSAEIDRFPSAVLAARHPESINLGDVTSDGFIERAAAIGRPDVLVFGSPCQDFSVAGKRIGLDGDRGNMAIIGLRIARELRPRWLVFENVPGLFSSYSGMPDETCPPDQGDSIEGYEDSDFAAFLSAVRECGYLGCYRVFDAQFAGVPQRRRRIFFVGYLGDWRPGAAVLLEPESLRGDPPPSRKAGERVAPTIEARANAGGAGWGTDFLAGGGLAATLEATAGRSRGGGTPIGMIAFGGNRQTGDLDVATAVRAKGGTGHGDFESETFVVGPLTACGGTERKHGHGWGQQEYENGYIVPAVIAFDETQITHPENRSKPDDRSPQAAANARPPTIAFDCKAGGKTGFAIDENVVGNLRGDGHGGGHAAIAFQTRIARNGRGYEKDVVPALNGADAGATSDMRPCVAVFKPSHFTREKDGAPSDIVPPLGAEPDKGDQDPVILQNTAVRRLTPRECERLQGYPDDYTLVQFRGKPAADGPRYKALGNSMAVPELRWILNRIELFETMK